MTRYLVALSFIVSFATAAFSQVPDPDFSFTYTQLPRGNQTIIVPDGTVPLPDANFVATTPSLSQITSATFVATNRSARAITITNVSTNIAAFTFSGLPIFPVVVGVNQSFTFTINFQPSQFGLATGILHFDFALRAPVNFNLTGNGVGPVVVYEYNNGVRSQTVLPNDTLIIPDTILGEKTTVTMTVRNTGNADATVSFLASSDAIFALTNVPFLPYTLAAGTSISFNINFSPTQAATYTARLRIGNDSFNLSAVGVGTTLAFTSVVGAASTPLGTNGAVIFTPTQVGAVSTAQVQVSNTGNTVAFVNSISVTGPATDVFTLPRLPALPLKVDPGATVTFTVGFAPVTVGQATGSLRIDSRTFPLSGSGDAPPVLPGVSFSGSTGPTDAAQQIGVGITLDKAYPVQIDGKLTLSFAPTADVFSDDPAIAFASGGRTVNFIVPANSTTAVFGVSDTQVRLQTGTVAGTITLTATFATDAGGINLTPPSAPAVNITVRPSTPRITSVQLSSRTASAITVLITGYSPTRSADAMAFTFTPYVDPNNKDLLLDTTKLSLAVDGPFSVWYRSAASQAFGSLFTATVTLNVVGSIDAIQSLAVTLKNSLGTSNSGAVSLR